MKLTRREAVAGAAALAACGRSELEDEDDGLAASGPEDDDVTMIASKVPESTLPVHLTASTDLASNTTGGVNAVALKNPLGVAMEIHQIKWQISGPTESDLATNILGGIIACKLDLGTNPITNGFVPVWCFGRPEDLRSEVRLSGTAIVSVTNGATSFFSWRLPRPLYIPAGAVLTPVFQHRGLIRSTLTTRISYVGRSLLNKRATPKKVCVPYVASYVSPNFDFTPSSGAASSSESTETDLVNPHKEPLFLQRFVGRLQTYANLEDASIQMSEVAFPTSDTRVTARLNDSNGRPITNRATQFRQVFSGPTRSWEMDNGAVMDPNSYYKAFLTTDPSGTIFDPTTTYTVVLKQAHIGLVGWREIGGL